MKKAFKILLTTVVAGSLLVSANNFVKANTDTQKKGSHAYEIIKGIKSADGKTFEQTYSLIQNINYPDLKLVTAYMEGHSDKVVPQYYAYIADAILKVEKNESKAINWYLLGMVRAQEDVKMCKDDYAKNYPAIIQNGAEYTQAAYQKKDEITRLKLFRQAIFLDKNFPRYPNPQWACVMGNSTETLPLSEYNGVLEKYRTDMTKHLTEQINELKKAKTTEITAPKK